MHDLGYNALPALIALDHAHTVRQQLVLARDRVGVLGKEKSDEEFRRRKHNGVKL